MKSGLLGNICVGGSILAIAIAFAKDKEPGSGQMGAKGSGMTMIDMMGKSNLSCMATRDSLEALSKEVQEAIKSDDKGKMKAALQKADAHFAQMKNHMSMCMDMMEMMGGMMGGGKPDGGMGMGGKTSGEAKASVPEKEKDQAEQHEKHHPK